MSYPYAPAFTSVARHYDALMRGVPYRHWVRYLDRLCAKRSVEPRRILDLACGTGNVAEILCAQGYEVAGVDVSADMIAEARRKAGRKGLAIDYFEQDAAEMELSGYPFDLCVSLFDSLNYIVEPERLQLAVCRVFAHLHPDGMFVFDVNSAFALENNFFDQDNMESDDRLRYSWRSYFFPETRLCRVDMRFFLRERNGVDSEFRETHLQYAYTESELRGMLMEAGFDRIETYHAYTMTPVRQNTDRIFFVAQRPSV